MSTRSCRRKDTATGASATSASVARLSRPAGVQLLPPAISRGRSASASSRCARATSVGAGCARAGVQVPASPTCAASWSMSSGNPTTTGPGRPLVAVRNAACRSSGSRPVSSISTAHFAMGAWNMSRTSISWKASRPRVSRATCPTSRSIGVESWCAVWTPTLAWHAPGPRVTRQTPGRPVSLPAASAMLAAPASWRHVMRRRASRRSKNASRTGR